MKSLFKQRGTQFLILTFSLLILTSCSVTKQISQSAKADVLDAKALQTAHVGISIFDPSANKYLYNYEGDKYFVPASNIKIPTCYAAMKYLGDSLVTFLSLEKDDTLYIYPTGDPTLLNSEFPEQQAFNYLKKTEKVIDIFIGDNLKLEEYGNGWSWNDYLEPYMTERSTMPVYGNLVTFELKESRLTTTPSVQARPYMDEPMIQLLGMGNKFMVTRSKEANKFTFNKSDQTFERKQIPFKTLKGITNYQFLKDTLNKLENKVIPSFFNLKRKFEKKIYSQPTDSLLKPMMHRSDNFFAEQSLLMVSNEVLGVMNDAKIIDTILKTDFKDLPQKPRWVDGSGLSRYNLFTPQDLVAILNKMKNEFSMERIKVILPTGGEGTISNYYKADSGYIYAKTGTLSGVVAFSGFLYTKKGKLLIFSTLVNNHQATSTEVRKAMEKFLQGIRNKY
ncbi:MAG: D-alanyl-D-alanine carboxypeptidase [Chitinophagaceae bacterium]|nr:D-alanyl-D-alanine carboxypeptidase [Chitinophagaceae bacterium]